MGKCQGSHNQDEKVLAEIREHPGFGDTQTSKVQDLKCFLTLAQPSRSRSQGPSTT